jgi:hypothetical protein
MQRAVGRLMLSSIDDPNAIDRLWPDVLAVIRARKPPQTDEQTLVRSLAVHAGAWLADRRGDQAGWTFPDTTRLAKAMQRVMLAQLDGKDQVTTRQQYSRLITQLSKRTISPYQACELICTQQPPVCLYRRDVAELLEHGEQAAAWRQADIYDALSGKGRRQQSWEVALDAAYSLIEFPESDWSPQLRDSVSAGARRTALCFIQQALDKDPLKNARTSRRIIARLLAEANQLNPSDDNELHAPSLRT